MKRVIPILLAGGGGSRLWPLSRQLFPKQFSKLFGEKSLFQQAAQRIESSEVLIFDPPVIITDTKCRFTVNPQLKGIGINSGSVLIEPEAKNTAPAIMAACLFALKEDSDSTCSCNFTH